MPRSTTYSTNRALRDTLKRAMARDQFNQKRKSQWICLAVARLVDADPTLSGVGAGEDLDAFPINEAVIIDEATEDFIERAFRIVRGTDPQAEGIQGAVIRAAIRYAAQHALAA